jgi:hypothetical protein
VDFAVRLLVDEFDRLLKGGGRNPHQAGIGQAEFEDEEDREGDRQRPNASAESTSVLLSANTPMPKNSASVQNTRIAMRTQETGGLATCSDISNRDC